MPRCVEVARKYDCKKIINSLFLTLKFSVIITFDEKKIVHFFEFFFFLTLYPSGSALVGIQGLWLGTAAELVHSNMEICVVLLVSLSPPPPPPVSLGKQQQPANGLRLHVENRFPPPIRRRVVSQLLSGWRISMFTLFQLVGFTATPTWRSELLTAVN